ncbi:hypothetical protein [Natrarchaeobius oligotrophus]|uniref:Uncharacterized protein n=1 Tax=Natrarchaeobius chitinivorans TaxID=1679083 RepID=A0A3N6MDB8_NATCH|nr:hypothetical protein [Natrarchaeobius chitinivorans]RQH01934.1 hypothetical protein EA472_06420 [Natrarchaeobius chitinivorans]
MGTRTDAALAIGVLGAALVAFATVDASFSPVAFGGGAAATLAFELLASRDPEPIRRRWESRSVQAAAVVVAVAVVAVGAIVAPSSVLSAVIGALVAYLAFLVVVMGRRPKTDETT